ncbi:MAG: cytochrome P450 [Alphaproteobacteria bacterium]
MTTQATLETDDRPQGDYPVWDVDPYDEAVLADPYDYYAALRARGPVVWIARYGCWAMGRYAEVHPTFGDHQRFCSSRGVGLSDFAREKPWRPRSIVLEVDPPEHTRTRAVITRALSPRAVTALRDRFAAEAEALVDGLLERGTFDAVADFAEPFPLKVFPDAVGIGPEDRRNLIVYGMMAFNAMGPDNRLRRDSLAHAATVVPWIAAMCQRDRLAPGGFGDVIYQAADDGTLSLDEAALLVRSLLSAGIDTTVTGLGNALWCFASNPDQWALLRDDPSLARAAFEEVLRFTSPVHTFCRTTVADVEVGGIRLGAGRKVMCVLGSANRDPAKWPDADRFDIRRDTRGHLGFGTGVHGCVGQAVAKLEAEVMFNVLARKVGRIALAGQPRWRPGNALHALDSLPVRFVPG